MYPVTSFPITLCCIPQSPRSQSKEYPACVNLGERPSKVTSIKVPKTASEKVASTPEAPHLRFVQPGFKTQD